MANLEKRDDVLKNAEKFEALKKAHHDVYEAIVALVDPVDEETLLQKLNLLDVNSWLEVVEERFIAKVCGFPTCSMPLTPKKFQKYCIDRKAKKVYEVSTDRAKYCGARCFEKSAAIQAQLEEQPLWITGPRSRKNYAFSVLRIWNLAKLFVIEEPRSIREFKPIPAAKQIEFVQDRILAQFNDLKIADNQKVIDSDSETEEIMDIEELEEERKEDEAFVTSIRNFVTTKSRQESNVVPISKTDESRLTSLLNKFKVKRAEAKKKIPPLIEAPNMPTISVQEKPLVEGTNNASKSPFATAWGILNQWLGNRVKELIGFGGPRLINKLDVEELRQFYGGDVARFESEIGLPHVDSLHVHQRQCEILINQLRKPWSQLEQRLETERSYYNELFALVRSFELNAENLPICSLKELHGLALIIFRLVCMFCHQDEEQKFFPLHAPPSAIVQEYVEMLNFDFEQYCQIIQNIEGFFV